MKYKIFKFFLILFLLTTAPIQASSTERVKQAQYPYYELYLQAEQQDACTFFITKNCITELEKRISDTDKKILTLQQDIITFNKKLTKLFEKELDKKGKTSFFLSKVLTAEEIKNPEVGLQRSKLSLAEREAANELLLKKHLSSEEYEAITPLNKEQLQDLTQKIKNQITQATTLIQELKQNKVILTTFLDELKIKFQPLLQQKQQETMQAEKRFDQLRTQVMNNIESVTESGEDTIEDLEEDCRRNEEKIAKLSQDEQSLLNRYNRLYQIVAAKNPDKTENDKIDLKYLLPEERTKILSLEKKLKETASYINLLQIKNQQTQTKLTALKTKETSPSNTSENSGNGVSGTESNNLSEECVSSDTCETKN